LDQISSYKRRIRYDVTILVVLGGTLSSEVYQVLMEILLKVKSNWYDKKNYSLQLHALYANMHVSDLSQSLNQLYDETTFKF